MSYITNHKQQFDDLKFQIANQDQLRRQANGGNSILFSYPPLPMKNNYILRKPKSFILTMLYLSMLAVYW